MRSPAISPIATFRSENKISAASRSHSPAFGAKRILRAQAMFEHQPRIQRAARIGAGPGGFRASSGWRW